MENNVNSHILKLKQILWMPIAGTLSFFVALSSWNKIFLLPKYDNDFGKCI
jgi:hypothetical protein